MSNFRGGKHPESWSMWVPSTFFCTTKMKQSNHRVGCGSRSSFMQMWMIQIDPSRTLLFVNESRKHQKRQWNNIYGQRLTTFEPPHVWVDLGFPHLVNNIYRYHPKLLRSNLISLSHSVPSAVCWQSSQRWRERAPQRWNLEETSIETS